MHKLESYVNYFTIHKAQTKIRQSTLNMEVA